MTGSDDRDDDNACEQCGAALLPGMMRCRECGHRRTPVSALKKPVLENIKGGTSLQLNDILARAAQSTPITPTIPEPARTAAPGHPADNPATRPPTSAGSQRLNTLGDHPPADDDRIAVTCECGKRFRVKSEWAGKRLKCPGCKQPVSVPTSRNGTQASQILQRPRLQVRFTELSNEIAALPTPEIQYDDANEQSSRPRMPKPLSGSKARKLIKLIEQPSATAEETEKRRRAVVELQDSYDIKHADAIRPLLTDPWIAIREAAALALGELRDPASTPALLCTLDDDVPEVRKAALAALARIRDHRAVPALLLYALQQPQMKFFALEAIVKTGPPAVPELIAALDHADPGIALEAVIALGRIKHPSAVDALVPHVHGNLTAIRAATAEALGAIGDKRASQSLAKALSDADSSVRVNAAVALGRIQDERVLKSLVRGLQDHDDDVVDRCAAALGELGSAQSVPSLFIVVKHDSPKVRATAADALGKIGDERAAAVLTPLLHDRDDNVRLKAVSAFRKFRHPEAVEPLIKLLDDPNSAIRIRALDCLGEIGTPDAMTSIIEALKTDGTIEVRVAAAKSLGLVGDESAIPILEEALDDEFTVRCRAIVSLGQIGNEGSLPPLLAMLQDPQPEVRYHATQALAEIGHPNALRPMEALLNDDDQMVRRGAARALVRLGDPRGEALLEESATKTVKRNFGKTFVGFTPDLVAQIIWPESHLGKAIILGVPSLALLLGAIFVIAPLLETPELVVPRGRVASLSIGIDSKTVVTGRTQGLIEFWSIPSESVSSKIFTDFGGEITGMISSTDDRIYVVSGNNVRLYTNQTPQDLPGHNSRIGQFVPNVDHTMAASWSKDGVVYIWDLNAGNAKTALQLPSQNLTSIALSPDGSQLAGAAKSLFVWSTADGSVVREVKRLNGDAKHVSFSDDGTKIVVSTLNDAIHIVDVANGETLKTYSHPRQPPAGYQLPKFLPGTEADIMAIQGSEIHIWRQDAEQPQIIDDHGLDELSAIDVDTEGKFAVFGGKEDSRIVILDLETGEVRSSLDVF